MVTTVGYLLLIVGVCYVRGAFVSKCPYGKYFKDVGQRPSCNPFSIQSCPPGYYCAGGPADEQGFCCKRENPCPHGDPFQINGDAPPCLGYGARKCPKSYSCVGSATTFSVCCSGNVCPNGKPIVNCFADPCQVTKCPRYPNATCKSNYCGGCNAEFFYKGRNVTKRCQNGYPRRS